MPILGIGLHVLIALYFAVHAVRNGQQLYWLIVLFSFPVLGSIVYFSVIYLPHSRLERTARRAVAQAARALDPTRELRDARSSWNYTPTAQNRMRLAAALLDAGQSKEAASHYDACLQGPFASDLEIRWGAARAWFDAGGFKEALAHLDGIVRAEPDFRAEAVALLRARTLAGAGDPAAAQACFEAALVRFGNFECLAEYLLWAVTTGNVPLATRLEGEMTQAMSRWNRHTREVNQTLLKRLEAARRAVNER